MPTDELILAESSTAPVVDSAQPIESAPPMEQWTPGQYKTWRETGDTPTSKPAESTPASEPVGDGTQSASTSKPESGTGTSKTKSADTRKAQLADDIQELLKQRAEIRAENERDRATKPTESVVIPKPQAEAPKRPKLADFEDYEQYEEARDKFTEDLADFKAKAAVDLFQTEQARKAQSEQDAKQQGEANAAWKQRVESFSKSKADYSEVAYSEATKMSDNMAALILESESGPAILYHLGKNQELAAEMATMQPLKLAKEMAKLELQMESGAANSPERDPATGLFTGAKKPTKAGPPAAELAGHAAAVDELDEALQKGDFAAYKRIEDRRDSKR